MFRRSASLAVFFAVAIAFGCLGQTGSGTSKQKAKALGDLELVERLLMARPATSAPWSSYAPTTSITATSSGPPGPRTSCASTTASRSTPTGSN